MKIALTGHRPERLRGHEEEVAAWINEQFKNYDNIELVYSGMARGADQIFANVAIENNIPVVCCFAYKKKEHHPEESRIVFKAKQTIFVSERYSNEAYWKRDKYMVDNCDVLFAVWDGIEKGGTWITLDYAEKLGKPVIYIPQSILKGEA